MSSTDTTPAFKVSRSREVTLTLSLLGALIAAGAVAYARLTGTEQRVDRHDMQIQVIEQEAKSTREILIRIDENVKDLRRGTRRAGEQP
jgi:hypothetical protein